MASQDQLSLVGYSGLYCCLCVERNRIPKQAKMLLQSLEEEGYDNWYCISGDDGRSRADCCLPI